MKSENTTKLTETALGLVLKPAVTTSPTAYADNIWDVIKSNTELYKIFNTIGQASQAEINEAIVKAINDNKLPIFTIADNGKVLSIDEQGNICWITLKAGTNNSNGVSEEYVNNKVLEVTNTINNTKTELETSISNETTARENAIQLLQNAIDAITNVEDTTAAIDTMKEVSDFLNQYNNTDNLSSILQTLQTTLESKINNKADSDKVIVDGSMVKIKIGTQTYVINGAQELIKPNAPTMTASATFNLTIGSSQNITINNNYSAQGGIVYYTIDGNDPNKQSASFTSSTKNIAIAADANMQAKDIVVKAMTILNGEVSDISSTTYTACRKVQTPIFTYTGDKYDSSRNISASCSTTGSTIKLSIDNGNYVDYSIQSINSSIAAGKYKVKAILEGWIDSDVASSSAVTLNSPMTYVGFTTSDTITESQIKDLTSYKLDSIKTATKYSITAPSDGYIWICQPNTLIPGNIFGDATYSAQSGFNAAITVGSWNCYRITNKVLAGDFDLYLKP